MPEEATVEEIEEIYFESWKMGIKALAIYRDNCKVGQPLSDGKSTKADNGVAAAAARADGRRVPPGAQAAAEEAPVARRCRSRVGGAEGYMTAGSYPDDGLGEVFLKLGKQGSTLAGVMDAFSIAISIALQYGVPLEAYVSKFVNMRFEPAGLTDDPDIRMAQSMMDYIFRRLALDYLPYEKRAGARHLHRRRACRAGLGGSATTPPAPAAEIVAAVDGGARDPRAVGPGREPGHPGRGRRRRRGARPQGGALLGGAARDHHRQVVGRAAVHDLRHQDASRRQLLRLRGLRLHQRLQLIEAPGAHSVNARARLGVGCRGEATTHPDSVSGLPRGDPYESVPLLGSYG